PMVRPKASGSALSSCVWRIALPPWCLRPWRSCRARGRRSRTQCMDGVGDPRRRRPSGARATLLIAAWLGLGAAPPPGYVEQHTPWTEPLCLTVEAKQTVPFAWDPPELVPDGAVWIRYDVRVDDQVVVSGWPWPAYAHI